MPGKTSIIMGVHSLQCTEKRPGGSVCAQLCPTLSDPMDCSLPGSSIHGIFQARVLEWVPLPSPVNIGLKRLSSSSSIYIYKTYSSQMYVFICSCRVSVIKK